jgi:hypothetical protein
VSAKLETNAPDELAAPRRGLRTPLPKAIGGRRDGGCDISRRGERKLGERRAVDRAAASRALPRSRAPLCADGHGARFGCDAETIQNIAD